MGYWMTHGSSLEEVKPELVSLSKRYEDGSGPELFYTDKCCQERASLCECFPSLSNLETNDGGQAQRVLLDIFHLMDRLEMRSKLILL